MKFECDSCHAQYMIADEKVGKRGVKVKCKRCSHVIVVRPDSDVSKKAPADGDARVEAPEEGALDAPPADVPAAAAAAPVPEPEATGPARPAPVSMAVTGHDTQLSDDAPPSWEADKTQMGKIDLAGLDTQAEPAAPAPVAVAAAGGVKGESSIGDALDDQLAGAFNSMFDEGRPTADLASLAAAAAEEQRGPTKVLDLNEMNVLRKATAERSNPDSVDRDALASLRNDLGASPTEASSGWNEPPAGDDGADEAVWHVAVDDEDVGPLTLADLGRYIEAGSVDRESLVWKTGMDNWLPAGEVKLVRDLFAKAPMPKIAPPAPEETNPKGVAKNGKAKSPNYGFDIGSPDLDTPRGSSPFDAVAAMDESDPNWQPHGLTDVYQAANLAEAAGAAGGGLIGNAGAAARSTSSAAEPEWRPTASSALASLVNDEIDRLSKGPPPVEDGAPLPADDSSINSGLPFSNLAGVDLDAGPAVADPLARPTRTQNQMPAFNGDFGQQQQQQQFAPQPYQQFAPPPAPAPKSPMLFVGIAGVAVVVVMLSLLTYKVVFDKPQQQVVVLGPNGLPIQYPAGTVGGQVAVNTPPTPTPPVAATGPVTPPPTTPTPTPTPPVEAAPTPTPPVEATPPVEPAKPEATKAEPVKELTAKEKKAAAAAAASTKKKDPEPEPTPPPKEEPKPKKNADCDPVLDFDCKAKGASSEPKAAAKTTLEKSDILAVVKGALPKVKECGAKNNASGTIKMTWKIDKSGKPSDVSVADPKFGGTPVGSCVANVVKSMRFPSYSGAAPPPVSIPLPLK